MPGPAGRRGRPRSADLDHRVRDAALALLRTGGPASVTMEAVAAAAGIAKTSLYRRYPDRRRLLAGVLHGAIGAPPPPTQGPVRERLRVALAEVWTHMADVLGPGGLAAIVADTDPEFTELFRATLRPYDAALVDQVATDARDGLLRPDVDADGVVTLLVGAYVGELVRRGSVGEDWLDRALDLVWATLGPRPES